MTKLISCGILIFKDEEHILGCHCTGKPIGVYSFDIPKGIKEDNETEIECIQRELLEETGLNINEDLTQKTHLGKFAYLFNKDLYLMSAITSSIKSENLKSYTCNSYFTDKFGNQRPEVNGYKWINFRTNINYFHRSLVPILLNAIKVHKEKCNNIK